MYEADGLPRANSGLGLRWRAGRLAGSEHERWCSVRSRRRRRVRGWLGLGMRGLGSNRGVVLPRDPRARAGLGPNADGRSLTAASASPAPGCSSCGGRSAARRFPCSVSPRFRESAGRALFARGVGAPGSRVVEGARSGASRWRTWISRTGPSACSVVLSSGMSCVARGSSRQSGCRRGSERKRRREACDVWLLTHLPAAEQTADGKRGKHALTEGPASDVGEHDVSATNHRCRAADLFNAHCDLLAASHSLSLGSFEQRIHPCRRAQF
jgi:hypothetical protein